MIDWNSRFLKLAREVSTWSNIPDIKVGCVLVDERRRVVGHGYNTLPSGVHDRPERIEDLKTRSFMVVHAEVNALMQSTGDLKGATAYITHRPCANCTGALIQAGISKVVVKHQNMESLERFADSFVAGETMMAEAGIKLEILS